MDHVVVIGSGPSGLATAAELGRRGIPAAVLERGDRLGAAWAGRYDGLRFNTSRWWSSLPGARFPKEYGWFPTRDQYVDYLDGYAARHRIPVHTGVTVERIDTDGDHWCLTTSGGDVDARDVVVATGLANRAVLPHWAVDSTFTGTVAHAIDYRNPARHVDRRVLVVGPGSSGMEIAHELATGGAREVFLAVRTPPSLLLRSSGGLPTDLPVPLLFRLPVPVVDGMLARMQRTTIGDLSRYGLPPAPEGALAALMARGAGTAVVDKSTIDAIRDGAIRIVPAVERLDATGARLTDGRHVEVDDVILATGYSTALDRLIGPPGVVDHRGLPRVTDGGEAAPGLRFIGYVYRPGLTGYVGKLARRAAREIADQRNGRRPRAASATAA